MISYCYTCDISKELGEAKMELYETKHGMKAIWVDIHETIQHNKKTMARVLKKKSIEWETFL